MNVFDCAIKIEEEAKVHRIALKVSYYENMFSIKFSDIKRFKKFYNILLEEGIYFAPSEFEANFVSFSHTRKDIEKTVSVITRALERI